MGVEKSIFEGVIMVRGKGIGYVPVPDFEEDILIPTEALNFALDGDIVEIEIDKKIPGKRQEGKVLRVIDQKHTEFIGVLQKKANVYRLLPDNRRIHIRPIISNATPSYEGMKVVVHIDEWKLLADPIGSIVEVLGRSGDHETEMQAIIGKLPARNCTSRKRFIRTQGRNF